MAVELEVSTKVETKSAEDSVDNLNKKFEQFLDLQIEALAEQKKAADASKKALEESAKATNSLSKGFKGVGLAIKAAGVGLVIGALSTLKDIFMQNQVVADKVATAFEAVSIVFNEIVNALVSTVEEVSEAGNGFSALGKVISSFLTIAMTPLKLGFFSISLAVQNAQLAWEKSFFGDKDPETINNLTIGIRETKQSIVDTTKELGKSYKDIFLNFGEAVTSVYDVVSGTVEKAKNISIEAAIETAAANVELKNSAEVAAAQLQGLIEKYDRQAELLRQVRDDDRKTIAERIAANEELGRVLDKQAEEQIAQANKRVEAAQAELDKDKENIQAKVAYQEALNEVAATEAQVEGFRSEQLTNRNALLREQEQALLDLRKIGKDDFELAKVQAEQEREQRIKQIELFVQDEQMKKDLLLAVEEDYAKALEKIDKDKADAEGKSAKDTEKLEKDKRDAKIGLAKQGFKLVDGLAEKNAKAQKGIAAAQATFDTYAAIAGQLKAASSAGQIGPLAIAQAVATGAFGFMQVKKILSTNVSGGGSVSSGGGGGAAGGAVPTQTEEARVPSFDFFNQGVGGTQNAAFDRKAYVVSQDIKDQRQLDERLDDLAKIQ